jgi:hypothetical protein
MSGAIPPLPQYAFTAWCLVKAQGQLYLYLYNPEDSDLTVGSVCEQNIEENIWT